MVSCQLRFCQHRTPLQGAVFKSDNVYSSFCGFSLKKTSVEP
jgi:hypothetical protein